MGSIGKRSKISAKITILLKWSWMFSCCWLSSLGKESWSGPNFKNHFLKWSKKWTTSTSNQCRHWLSRKCKTKLIKLRLATSSSLEALLEPQLVWPNGCWACSTTLPRTKKVVKESMSKNPQFKCRSLIWTHQALGTKQRSSPQEGLPKILPALWQTKRLKTFRIGWSEWGCKEGTLKM